MGADNQPVLRLLFDSKNLIMSSQTALLDFTISEGDDISSCEATIIEFFDNHLLNVAKFSEGLTLVHRHSGGKVTTSLLSGPDDLTFVIRTLSSTRLITINIDGQITSSTGTKF